LGWDAGSARRKGRCDKVRGVIEPPLGQEPGAPGDLAEPRLGGSSLWEIALEETSRRNLAVSQRQKPKARRILRLWVAGGVTLIAVVAAGLWLDGTSRATSAGPTTTVASSSRSSPAAGGAGRAALLVCSAQPVNPNPVVGGTTEIAVSHIAPGPAITVTLIYPGGSERYSVPSDNTAVSYVPIALNGPPPDEVVEVLVSAGNSTCRTSFTPTAAPSG
jgi:hypothetical protein